MSTSKNSSTGRAQLRAGRPVRGDETWLDSLVRLSLGRALGETRPPAAVWERIRRQVAADRPRRPAPAGSGWAAGAVRGKEVA